MKKFIFIFCSIFLIFISIAFIISKLSNSPMGNIEKKDVKFQEIYKYPDFGIYAYYIPKKNFNLKDVVNFTELLPYSKTQFLSVFIYDYKIDKTSLDKANKRIPLNTLDVAWKAKPYFYIGGLKGNQLAFCKIERTQQIYYKKNILRGEKFYSYKQTFDYGKLDALCGCNPSFKRVMPAKVKDEVKEAQKLLQGHTGNEIEYSEAKTWLEYLKAFKKAEFIYYNNPNQYNYNVYVLAHQSYKEYEEFLKYGKAETYHVESIEQGE